MPRLKSNNRFQTVKREHLHGSIEGVDYGYNLSCIARSPRGILLWSGGTPYWSGIGMQSYGSSTLYLYRSRDRNMWNKFAIADRIGTDGGRLSASRIESLRDDLNPPFDNGEIDQIVEAVRRRKTLLIEGGGWPLSPHHARSSCEQWDRYERAAHNERGAAMS